jgi:hypothetical protein
MFQRFFKERTRQLSEKLSPKYVKVAGVALGSIFASAPADKLILEPHKK